MPLRSHIDFRHLLPTLVLDFPDPDRTSASSVSDSSLLASLSDDLVDFEPSNEKLSLHRRLSIDLFIRSQSTTPFRHAIFRVAAQDPELDV